jgi:hypothetical protein
MQQQQPHPLLSRPDAFGAVLQDAACMVGLTWQLWAVLLILSFVGYLAVRMCLNSLIYWLSWVELLTRIALRVLFYVSRVALVVCALCLVTSLWLAHRNESIKSAGGVPPMCSSQPAASLSQSFSNLVMAFLWQRYSDPLLGSLYLPECLRPYVQ